MEIKFSYDEFGLLDAKAEGKLRFVAWVLTDNNHEKTINQLLKVVSEIKISGGEWDSSFNKSYVNINPVRIRCGDLYNEEDYVDIDLDKFLKILKSWKSFVRKGVGQEGETINV